MIKVNAINLVLTVFLAVTGVIILSVSMSLYNIPTTDKVYDFTLVSFITILIILKFNSVFEINWSER